MSRINHEKLNLQRRAANQGPPLALAEYYSRFSSGRLKMPFGKYKGIPLPSIFFQDLSYFSWMIRNDVLKGGGEFSNKLAAYFKKIVNRAQRILPPESHGRKFGFAIILDKKGVFYEFMLVRKGSNKKLKLENGLQVAEVVPVLDATIAGTYKNPKLGHKRMADCLKKVLFLKYVNQLTPVECESFFDCEENFDI